MAAGLRSHDEPPALPAPAMLLSPADGDSPRPSNGQGFGFFTWRSSPSEDVVAEVAEFAYQDDARLFVGRPALPGSRISSGQLWTTGGNWNWRVWSITRSGDIVFSDATDISALKGDERPVDRGGRRPRPQRSHPACTEPAVSTLPRESGAERRGPRPAAPRPPMSRCVKTKRADRRSEMAARHLINVDLAKVFRTADRKQSAAGPHLGGVRRGDEDHLQAPRGQGHRLREAAGWQHQAEADHRVHRARLKAPRPPASSSNAPRTRS